MKEQTKAGTVLPKRRPDREHYMTVPEYGSGYDAGWNACLDALESFSPQPPPEQAGSVVQGIVAYLAESSNERYLFHGDDAASLDAYTASGFRITELASGSAALDALKSIAAVLRDPMRSTQNQGDHALRIAIAAIATLSAAPAPKETP